MNTHTSTPRLLAAALALLALAACSHATTRPDGADAVRAKLTQLQADPQLADRAPVAMKAAEDAVSAAEIGLARYEGDIGRHRVLVADRKVDTARALAQARAAEDGRLPPATTR